MALNLRARFGPQESEFRPSLADDFAFSPADYPSLRELRIDHDAVELLETPLAIDRRYFLSQGSDSLRLELALCLQGHGAAVELLFQRATAFQREPNEGAVFDLARSSGIGDVGVAWPWGERERDGVAGFVRYNVLVFLLGRHETLLQQARDIDAALARLDTTAAYAPHADSLFDVGAGLNMVPGAAPNWACRWRPTRGISSWHRAVRSTATPTRRLAITSAPGCNGAATASKPTASGAACCQRTRPSKSPSRRRTHHDLQPEDHSVQPRPEISHHLGALNIRKNKDFETALPEYDSSIARTAQQQCAAYAIAPTRNQAVFVRCTFQRVPATGDSFVVKATGGGVLGALDERTVSFSVGGSAVTVDFPLTHRQFSAAGRHDVNWQWWVRTRGSKAWQPLVTTSHRIYLVLDLPGAPWTQAYGDKRTPWTDLLDHACAIAAGRKEEMGASISLAKAIHSNYALRYDIRFGAPRYGFGGASGSFNLSNWIGYVLQATPPPSPTFCQGSEESYNDNWIINCYDAAASLALMGKVVGARLDYHFHQPFGYLRFVTPIGRGKCNNPFHGCWGNDPVRGADDATRTGFGNHAYTRLRSRRNFDACMKQWRSWLEQLVLGILYFIAWLVLLVITLGLVNRFDLLERAQGWLVNLRQADYNAATIDTSTAAEAASAAGGSPVACTLNFQVT